ncbi:hypothetical protein FOL47_004180 [Perkinsus chesapeaki]|uniref:J domain-containing protein n=1 Tax=Perkinsus chesapeaki TaxID=330153 RepID=A0A7J6MZ89_PERCH|nr:hypothetical protein FOL47_004180 [Perkinsus chesapeaki]
MVFSLQDLIPSSSPRSLHASSRLPPMEIDTAEEALLRASSQSDIEGGVAAARVHLIPDNEDEEESSSGWWAAAIFKRSIPLVFRPPTWYFGIVLPVFYMGYASAASVHMGSNPKEISPHAFDALLSLLLGVGLYSAGKIKDRLNTVSTWLLFGLFATLSTVSCTLFQEIVGTRMTLSLKSITHWRLLQWIAATILSSAVVWCLWLHVLFAIRGRYLAQFIVAVTGAFIAITFLTLVAEPTSDGLHLHHWFTAYLMAMICREPKSRISFAWQSLFVGIWLHGASVWGYFSSVTEVASMTSIFSRKNLESMSRGLEQASRFMHDKVREAVSGDAVPRRDSQYGAGEFAASSSSTFVHYLVVDSDREGPMDKYNMFVMPCESFDLTVGAVKDSFPVNPAFFRSEAFAFRFRCNDEHFDDYVWLDMTDEFNNIRPPMYRGDVWVKALPVKPYRLPEDDFYYEEDPRVEAAVVAYRERYSAQSTPEHRPKRKAAPHSRPNSMPPSSGSHQPRPAAGADLMDLGGNSGGHANHRTVSNPPLSSSSYSGIAGRGVTATATPQVRAEDLDREALKAARLKAKEERIRAKHEEFTARQREEANKREAKLEAQTRLADELDHWAYTEQVGQGQPKDIRTLLANMDEVLWPNSGWTSVSAGELMVNTAAVKKAYRKAIILCHPDRHQSASADEQYRADRIFNALNEAFKRQ